MQSVYTIYFNNGEEVTPLRYCNGYSHAEELMETVATEFMKVNYTGRPRRICKYEEGSTVETFKAQLYKDATFPEGIVFVQKKHESTVYEKTFVPGYIGGTTTVKCLGRISVMAQQYEIPQYVKQQIENQQQQILSQNTVIVQQETTIRRQEQDLKRSDYQIAHNDIELDQLRDMIKRYMDEKKSWSIEMEELKLRLAKIEAELDEVEAENASIKDRVEYIIPEAPEMPDIPKRPQTDLSKKNAAIAPVLSQLKDAVVSGSWRRSEHIKAVKKLKDDRELANMIAEIDAMVVDNGYPKKEAEKIKTE